MDKLVKLFLLSLFFYYGALLSSEPEYIRYIDAISSRVADQIEKEFNIHCGVEGGSMPNNIALVRLGFTAQRRATLEEARIMHVRCTEMLIKAINADERIRPFLAEYPFPPSRIELSISFRGPSGSWDCDGTINFILEAHDTISCFITDPIDSIITSFYEEPYAEALKIVQQSTLTNKDLCSHQVKPYEPLFDNFMKIAVKKIEMKWGLQCLKAGGNIRDGVEELGFTFLKQRSTPLEEARKMEISIIDFLTNSINNDESLKPYIKNYPLKEDKIRVRLVFGKNEFHPFRDKISLYEVRPSKGRLLYHTLPPVEPDGSMLLTPDVVANESYEESRRHLCIEKSK